MPARPAFFRLLRAARLATAIAALPLGLAMLAPQAASAQGPAQVVVLPTSGVVDDVMASYVAGGVQRAQNDGAAAVVVQLDTLGGAEPAMERIVSALDAGIPTIVWVGPTGARAASAGTFITLAANLDYMATGTNIGAASPVTSSGGDIASALGQTEAQKVMQFAISKIQSIAQKRHPQAVEWATTTVRDAKAYSAQDAVTAHAVNGIAESLDSVLAQAEGQTVTVAGGRQVVVHVAGASVVTIGEDPIQAVLHTLDDPNIAFILLVIGILCVLVEFFHPTVLVGVTGAAALILSFYGSGSLPLNVLGVLLVVLGIAMLVLEPNVPSHGLLAIGGMIAFIVGAVAFYGSPGPYLPAVNVAWPVIVTMTAVSVGYALIFVRLALELRRHPPVAEGSGMVGSGSPVGSTAEVRSPLDPVGTVYVAGEAWSARTVDGRSIPEGSSVRVVGQDGLTLIVEAADAPATHSRATVS